MVEELGRKQTTKTKNKISKALMGDKNPAFKDGRRSSRRIAGLKPKDGKMVHHKDGNRKHNARSNLRVINKKDRGKHEKIHDRGKNFQSSGGRKKVKSGARAKRLKRR